jgi:hypothetical protein
VYNALIADTGRVSLPEYAAAHSSMPPLPFQRYGILGSAVAEMTKPRTIWYCHLWGINFGRMSSNNIEGRGILKLPVDQRFAAIRVIMDMNAAIIEKCLCTAPLITNSGQQNVHFHMAGVGTGAYLNKLPEEMHITVRNYYRYSMLRACRRAVHQNLQNGSNVTLFVSIPMYSPTVSRTDILRIHGGDSASELEEIEQTTIKILSDSADQIPKRARVFLLEMRVLKDTDRTLTLNAWDDRSYIGNMGSRDPTLDGWTVASIQSFPQMRKFCLSMANTTFAHNTAVWYARETNFL